MPTDEILPDRSGFVRADDQDVHWEYFGAGEREVVCLLNGVAMSTRSWYPFLKHLVPEHDVLLYDYPGQGESSQEDRPCSIPRFCDYLTTIVDGLGIGRFHLMGISYGGFVGLDYARLYQERLHTLTVSGILLSREELFRMYQELSLRFYRSGPLAFEIYTHYMYEKIFGEEFVRRTGPALEAMRQKFHERFKDRTHCLIRLTEAQDALLARLEANLPGYRAVRTPILVLAGAQDRCIPPWVQQKLIELFSNARFEAVPDCGHVVYLERPELFFGTLKTFMKARTLEGWRLAG